MPIQQDGTAGIRDSRLPPFCFQTHAALDAIRAHWEQKPKPYGNLSTARSVYVALTEAANRNGGANARTSFKAGRKAVAHAAGVSVDTLDTYVKELRTVGVVEVVAEKVGTVNLPNMWKLVDPPGTPPPGTPPSRVGSATPSRVGAAQVLEEVNPKKGNDPDGSSPRGGGAEPDWPMPDVVLVEVAGEAKKQNLGWNALAEACGGERNDPNLKDELSAALNGPGPGKRPRGAVRVGIRALVLGEIARQHGITPQEALEEVAKRPEDYERAVAAVIGRRASQWRAAMPDATLSPPALAKWWLRLEQMPGARAGVTGDQARRIADDELRRIRS